MNAYRVAILTPEKTEYEGRAVTLTVPGDNGLLTILAGHAPMVAVLAKGAVTVRTEHETLEGSIGSGLLRVGRNEAVMLVHGFEWAKNQGETKAEDSEKADESRMML